MSDTHFRGWFSDLGFTVRVLIIADFLEELFETVGAHPASAAMQDVQEVRETAQLEVASYEDIGRAEGYFLNPTEPDVTPEETDLA